MDYRDILGLPKKQPKKKVEKTIKKQPPKPSITEKLSNQFGPLNEWSSKPPTEKRWSKNFNGNQGLTEFEQRGGKDNVNEGPAYEWSKVYSNAEKAYMQFQKAIDELGRYTTKKTGEKTDQKIFEKQWKKQVVPFYQLMKSWIRGKI